MSASCQGFALRPDRHRRRFWGEPKEPDRPFGPPQKPRLYIAAGWGDGGWKGFSGDVNLKKEVKSR